MFIKHKDYHNWFVKLYKASSLSRGLPTFETKLPCWELVDNTSFIELRLNWACVGPMFPSGLTNKYGILVECPHGYLG